MLNFGLTVFICIIMGALMSGIGANPEIIIGFTYVVAPLTMIMFNVMDIKFLLEQRK